MVSKNIFHYIPLFLLCFSSFAMMACAERSSANQQFQPYLESNRHVQIPQWEHEDWYVEDWTSQAPAADIINGFYQADILKKQKTSKKKTPVLIAGPNFYHLSGLDKRRVISLVDYNQNLTNNGSNEFFVQDWYSRKKVGVYNAAEGFHMY